MTSTLIDHNAALPNSYLPTADQIEIAIDGEAVRVVRYHTFDEPCYLVHVSWPDDAQSHELEFRIKRKYHQADLLGMDGPVALTKGGARGRSLVANVTGQPYLCLACDGIGYVFVAVDPAQSLPQGDGVLTAADTGLLPDAETVQTDAFQAAIDQVSASDALTTLVLGPGHYRTGDFYLKSNVRLHLASGAVLQASDHAADIGDPTLGGHAKGRACLVQAIDASNVAITGHGHVDGNRSVLDMERYFKGMAVFTRCHNLRLDGPVFANACGWNTTPRHSRDVVVQRMKFISNRPRISCINTDGCNPDGCQNLTISHCLAHTGDDAVAVKSTNYGGAVQNCSDITIDGLLAVNNSSTAKVGTETMAERMERISFRRVCAVRTTRLVALDAYDYATIGDISWEDCYVHQFDDVWVESFVVDLQAPEPRVAFRSIPAKATAKRLQVRNITSAQQARARVLARIDDGIAAISDVSEDGITIAGEAATLTWDSHAVVEQPQ